MQALLVVDAQNEFSPGGRRPVPNHAEALLAIRAHVEAARRAGAPIAWVQHHNRPDESPAFVPGSWGAQLSPGLEPAGESGRERLFVKDVFGAFTTTGAEAWLRSLGVDTVVVTGFYAHMCVSTSAREALVRGFDVRVDPAATGSRALEHPVLGAQSADEVVRSAFLQLENMGAEVVSAGVWAAEPLALATAAA
jgi:nicotinamidase-related amidase